MKFERLSLDKFGSVKVQRVNDLKGGVVPESPIPNGGSACSTQGGSRLLENLATVSWSSDNEVYDADGFQTVTDHENWQYQPPC